VGVPLCCLVPDPTLQLSIYEFVVLQVEARFLYLLREPLVFLADPDFCAGIGDAPHANGRVPYSLLHPFLDLYTHPQEGLVHLDNLTELVGGFCQDLAARPLACLENVLNLSDVEFLQTELLQEASNLPISLFDFRLDIVLNPTR
jgi:hypothetical protein